MVHWIPAAWRRRSYNLRWLLVAVPVLVVLPILLHSVLLLQLLSDRAARELRDEIDQGSHALAAAVDRQIAGATGLLELLAASPSLRADAIEAERFATIVRTVLEGGWGLQSVTLRDREGRNLMGGLYRSDDGTSPLYPHEQQALESMQPSISDLYLAGSVERPATSIAVPVVREGRPLWVLSGRLDPLRLSGLLLEQMPRHESVAALLDGNRTIIARSRDGDRWFGERASPDTVEALDSAPAGVRRIRTRDGDHLLWSWTTLPNGWSLFLGTPAESYEGPLRVSMLRLALTGLLALALGIGLAALVARRVLRSGRRNDCERPAPGTWKGAGLPPLGNPPARRAVPRAERGEPPRRAGAARTGGRTAGRARGPLRGRSRESGEGRVHLDAQPRVAQPDGSDRERAQDPRAYPGAERRRARGARDGEPTDRAAQAPGRRPAGRDADHAAQARAEAGAGRRRRRGAAGRADGRAGGGAARTAVHRRDRAGRRRDRRRPGADPAGAREPARQCGEVHRETDAIRVDVHGDADAVEIRVTDDGVGIEAASLSRVFDLFAQADITIDRSQGGLGIGLAWVKSIVEMHGGNVSAASAGKGRGACFTVRLPRLPPSLIGRMPLAAG